MGAGEATGNRWCVDSMLVMGNRKMSHMSSFLTRSTLPYGRSRFKRSFIKRHVFIKRVAKAQEVRWDREQGLMGGVA